MQVIDLTAVVDIFTSFILYVSCKYEKKKATASKDRKRATESSLSFLISHRPPTVKTNFVILIPQRSPSSQSGKR